jgi:F-type H+-transporting ATPase subunit delta
VEEIASVYSRSLFEVGKENDKLDTIKDELDQFTDALDENRELQVYFFSPYFSSAEKKEGIGKVIENGDEHFVRFLELLAERHRLPALFRIRREFNRLWAEENKQLPVTITSAVELDKDTVKDLGKKIEDQTGQQIDLTANVDPDLIGGLRMQVGNMVYDATIRGRLEKLRREVARAA